MLTRAPLLLAAVLLKWVAAVNAFLIPSGGIPSGGTRPTTVLPAVRAKVLREHARRRVAGKTVKILSPREVKAKREAQYAKKKEESANAGVLLSRMQDRAFHIGVIGYVGKKERTAAVKALELTLTRAGLRAGARYVKADVRIFDLGGISFEQIAETSPRQFAQLRRCNLFVHGVRCQEAPAIPIDAKEDSEEDESSLSSDPDSDELSPASPLEEIRSVRAGMAFADLKIIEERRSYNQTRTFWACRARALNEIGALRNLQPALERLYVKGGVLKPAGHLFANTVLRDGPRKRRDRVRWSIEAAGFLTCKHVLYAATLPPGKAAIDANDVNSVQGDSDAWGAAEVLQMAREYNLPAVAADFFSRAGADALGAKVLSVLPTHVREKAAGRNFGKEKSKSPRWVRVVDSAQRQTKVTASSGVT